MIHSQKRSWTREGAKLEEFVGLLVKENGLTTRHGAATSIAGKHGAKWRILTYVTRASLLIDLVSQLKKESKE